MMIQPQSLLDSVEEVFKCFFTLYGHGGHLTKRTVTICINFQFPFSTSVCIKFEKKMPNGFREEDV